MELKHHFSEEPEDQFRSMDQEEEQKPTPCLSVLQRLDRLDQLLQVLEEKQCLSARFPLEALIVTKVENQEQCKTISSALEEVHHKGTLMDRVSLLEDRVLQLSLEMDVGNTSKSSPSGTLSAEKVGLERDSNKAAREDNVVTAPQEEKKLDPLTTQDTAVAESEAHVAKPKGNQQCKSSLPWKRRWFGCFQRVGS